MAGWSSTGRSRKAWKVLVREGSIDIIECERALDEGRRNVGREVKVEESVAVVSLRWWLGVKECAE
jgi:hypothetical protein